MASMLAAIVGAFAESSRAIPSKNGNRLKIRMAVFREQRRFGLHR